jgi:hypothetical protein
MDSVSLLVVKEDLEHLRRDWGSDITEPNARRGSAVLRRLLVEDAYGHAWRALGLEREPEVCAVDLSILMCGADPRDVRYALAGGVEYRGMKVAGVVVRSDAHTPAIPPIGPVGPTSYPGEASLSLSNFLSSLSGVVEGKSFSRREVIKYIANVRGGVHLSDRERKAEKKLVERLGKIEKKILLMNSEGLIVEVVAIVQAIARSKSVDKFLEACARHGI